MRRAALLAASLMFATAAMASPVHPLVAAFGEDNIEILASRGYIVLQGPAGARRLAAVHWKSLEALAEAAASCRRLSAPTADGPDAGLDACRALPTDGAMTRGLHRLAAALESVREESWTLKASSASLVEPEGLKNLFQTPWGREAARRHRADRAEDPTPLVKGYFEDYLAGPRPDAEAVRHFLAVASALGASGAKAQLGAAAEHGAASEDLRALIRRYLLDERRRHGLARAQERARSLLADKNIRRELEELDALTAVLAARADLLASLETAISDGASDSGEPRLRSAGLHLQESTRLGQHELGDEAVLSGAYWVDGLPEGASIEVWETTFLETARGFAAVEDRRVKRRNGGPYTFARRLRIDEVHPFALRSAVSAASGTEAAGRVEVPVGPDYGLAVAMEAEALSHSLSCDPKSAEASYAALEELAAEAAKVKRQYKDLLERARKARRQAASDAEALAGLEEALSASRADASPQQCRYDTSRTDAAIKLARRLPAGCDRVLPELFTQRATISRRAGDQAWFLRASAAARSRRRSCDFDEAARLWSRALGVLEADPAARCGKAAEEASRAEMELAEVQTSRSWSQQLETTLAKAQAESLPAKTLESALRVRARLISLPDLACRRGELKRAERLSGRAGESENGPSDAEAARRMPREIRLASAIEAVKRARTRLLEKSDDAALPPSPPTSAPAPKAPAIKPKPAAAKKKSPAKKKATR